MSYKLYKKQEMTTDLAERLGCTRKEAKRIISTVNSLHVEKLSEGYDVLAYGIGTLKVDTVAERVRYIPSKGGKCTVPEHKKVKFRQRVVLV